MKKKIFLLLGFLAGLFFIALFFIIKRKAPKAPETFVQYIGVSEPDYNQPLNTYSQYSDNLGNVRIIFSQGPRFWTCYYDESAPYPGEKKINCMWSGSLSEWGAGIDWKGYQEPNYDLVLNTVSQWKKANGHVGTLITQGNNMWSFDWDAEASSKKTTCEWQGTISQWADTIDWATHCQGQRPTSSYFKAISQYPKNNAIKTVILEGDNDIWAFTQDSSGNTVCNAANVSIDTWWEGTVTNKGSCSKPSSWDTISQWEGDDGVLLTAISQGTSVWSFEEKTSGSSVTTTCLGQYSLSQWGAGILWGNLDSDDDGLPDSGDACPNQAGPISNNGCPEGTSPQPSASALISPSPSPSISPSPGISPSPSPSPDSSVSPSPSPSPSPSSSPSTEAGLVFTASLAGLSEEGHQLLAATLYAEGTDWIRQAILDYEGNGWVDISELDQSETYNFFLKIHPSFISEKEVDLANLPEIVDFGELKTGDLNADNEINGLDWSWMKMYFGEGGEE